jgi:NADPH:quinone reductase-like Zn-dependent oxidoreductase
MYYLRTKTKFDHYRIRENGEESIYLPSVSTPKMKAVVISSPGGPEVLRVQEVAEPELRDDEVLIKVAATALNRADMEQRKGAYPPPEGASEYLGVECSGVIEVVGRRVSRWKVGDQVKYFSALLGC